MKVLLRMTVLMIKFSISFLFFYRLVTSKFPLSDLVDDAAGEEGRSLLTVSVEVQCHQSVGPH